MLTYLLILHAAKNDSPHELALMITTIPADVVITSGLIWWLL